MTTPKPKTYTVAQLKRMEEALFKAHLAYQRALWPLQQVVGAMRGRTVRNRKNGKLYTISSGGDAWHMISVMALDDPTDRACWRANPSEFEIVT